MRKIDEYTDSKATFESENINMENDLSFSLKSLKIDNYNSLVNFCFDFHEHVECDDRDNEQDEYRENFLILIGPNGCGKSSVLESIFLIFSSFTSDFIEKNFTFNFTIEYCIGKSEFTVKREGYRYFVINDYLGKRMTFSGKRAHIRKKLEQMNAMPNCIVTFYSGFSDRIGIAYRRVLTQYKGEYTKAQKGLDEISTLQRRFFPTEDEYLPIYMIMIMLRKNSQKKSAWSYIIEYCQIFDLKEIIFEGIIPKGIDDATYTKEQRTWINKLNPQLADSVICDSRKDGEKVKLQVIIDVEAMLIKKVSEIEKFYFLCNIQQLSENAKMKIIVMSNNIENGYNRQFNNQMNIHAEAESLTIIVDNAFFSEGQRQVIKLLGALCLANYVNGLLLIDEPDAFLNPRWKYDLSEIITNVLNKTSTVLIATHEPMIINGVHKNNIRIFEKKNQKLEIHVPREFTRGMGIDGILKSEYYGLSTSYDRKTSEKYKRQLELYVKLTHGNNITPSERQELCDITQELSYLPSSYSSIDFLYYDFLNVYKDSRYYTRQYFSYDDMIKKRNQIEEIISQLFEDK